MQIIITLCDRHPAEEAVKADAGTQIISVNKRAVELDLCTNCLNELMGVLTPIFDEGRRPGRAVMPTDDGTKPKPKRPSGRDGTYKCRVRGCKDVRESAQGRSMHELRTHDYHHNKEMVKA